MRKCFSLALCVILLAVFSALSFSAFAGTPRSRTPHHSSRPQHGNGNSTLVIPALVAAAPASFEVRVNADESAVYSITLAPNNLTRRIAQHQYVTQPLFQPARIGFTVRWTNEHGLQVEDTVYLNVQPGGHHTVTITIPRVEGWC